MAGKFIVLEGLEGAGKSTAIQTVSTVLNEHGINEIVYTREPGGTPIAEQLRKLIKTVTADDPLTYKAELLMFYAARIQLVENIILPALKAGKWVIGDRHDLSTQAYQGGGRELPQHFLDLLRTEVLEGFEPDLTLYLDVPPTLGLERARARGELDRIEQETLSFFERTRTHFLKATEDHPDKIKKIDASQSLDKVQIDIRFTLTEWLKHNANH